MSFAHIPHLCYSVLGVHLMEQVYFEQGSQICRAWDPPVYAALIIQIIACGPAHWKIYLISRMKKVFFFFLSQAMKA